MKILGYIDKHEALLKNWLVARDMGPELVDALPKHGYVVYMKGVPTAAGFLRVCEGQLAILEGLITNPEVPGEDRHTAIDELVSLLIDDADDAGFTRILAYSIEPTVLERSKKHGFERMKETLIALEIGR